MYSIGGDSNNDVGVDDVGMVSTNGGHDTNFDDDYSKFYCDQDIDDGGVDNKDDGGVDDDIDSNIGNDSNCGNGRNKIDCSENTADDDGNSNADVGPSDDYVGDTNDDDRGGDVSDSESNDGANEHKNDDDDDDGGCLDSVKNCFKNKRIVLENFSNFSIIKIFLFL